MRLPDVNLIKRLITSELTMYRNRSVSMRHLQCDGKSSDPKTVKKGKSCRTFADAGDDSTGAKAINRSHETGDDADYLKLAITLQDAHFSNSDVKRLIDMACFTAARNALDANRFQRVPVKVEGTLTYEYHASKERDYRLKGSNTQVILDGVTYMFASE